MSDRELARLRLGPEPGETPKGLGTERFQVTCKGNSREVLARTKEVLEMVLFHCAQGPFPSDEQWRRVLPVWFLSEFARERTEEETEEYKKWWNGISWEQKQTQLKKAEKWIFSNWIYWFRPENRAWWWWDAAATDSNIIWVTLVVKDWPFPWESLERLFIAAGARTVESEE
jgi:hypothetical protein